jgi:hypothetical protein
LENNDFNHANPLIVWDVDLFHPTDETGARSAAQKHDL